jgi:tetratricopeptide (TPR) repeat protein
MMRKTFLLIGLLIISVVTYAQKKEIKKAEKAIGSGNFTEAFSYINQAEGMISNAESSLKAQFYLIKGQAYLGDSNNDFEKLKSAGDAFQKSLEVESKGKYSDEVKAQIQNLRAALVNSAIEDQKVKNYDIASTKLYQSYLVSRSDTSDLYFAAGSSVSANDYDSALKYYKELMDLGYTGIEKQFFATEIDTGEEILFNTKSERDLMVKSKSYNKPVDKLSESRQSEILRNMTLIYLNKGDTEAASAIIKEARDKNPDDISLIRAEAEMAYKVGEMERYNDLMQEIVAADPNNPEVYYNLGVGSNKMGDKDKALEYYEKALELDPSYPEALINTASLILEDEESIIEEMNSLGTTTADYNRYDELKEVKNDLYRKAIPYLEKATEVRPDNIELVRTLMNIYSQLGEDSKYKAMKSRFDEMSGGE